MTGQTIPVSQLWEEMSNVWAIYSKSEQVDIAANEIRAIIAKYDEQTDRNK